MAMILTPSLIPLWLPLWTCAQGASADDGASLPAKERQAVTLSLQAYDEAWRKGDAERMLELFCPKSSCRNSLREEAASFLKSSRVTSCNSTVQFLARADEREGLFWGAYVQTNLGYLPQENGDRASVRFEHILQTNHFFLMRSDAGKASILRMEEFDPESIGALQAEKLGCPACNYDLARPKGWFLLPRGRGWSPCTDSLSLLHPTGKIEADFDILECHKNQDLGKIVESDETHLLGSCGAKPEQMKVASRKPLSPGENQKGLEVTGSIVRCCDETEQKLNFVRVYLAQGPVLYTLNIYGDAETFDAHRAEIDFLRNSLRIVNPKLTLPELRESMKSRHNPGGKIEQNLYSNQQYGIRVQGPNGWKAEDFSGPTLFLVRFTRPEQPDVRISIHAIEDRNGWPDEESVQRALEQRIAKSAVSRGAEPRGIESKRVVHRGLQAFAYESEWLWPGGKPMQERVCLLPAGQVLFVLEIEAPANRFEEFRKTFRTVLDSLSRF